MAFFSSNFLLSLGIRQRRAFFGEIENSEDDWREHLSLTRASSSRFYLLIITLKRIYNNCPLTFLLIINHGLVLIINFNHLDKHSGAKINFFDENECQKRRKQNQTDFGHLQLGFYL